MRIRHRLRRVRRYIGCCGLEVFPFSASQATGERWEFLSLVPNTCVEAALLTARQVRNERLKTRRAKRERVVPAAECRKKRKSPVCICEPIAHVLAAPFYPRPPGVEKGVFIYRTRNARLLR